MKTRKSQFVTALLAPAVATSMLMVSFAAHAQIEEITVTAERRTESVQDVSASVTALNGEMLARAGIDDPTRLSAIVPGFTFGSSGNEARPAIRGARTNNVGPTAEAVVGFFEDGIYAANSTSVLANYLDVKRVEVLRGPQGTLYGRNTFAGAVNVYTNEPDFDGLGGHAKAEIGDYNRTYFEGVVNMPLADNFAVRLALGSEKHDGYIKNNHIEGPQDDLRNQNSQVYRITAKWDVSDSTSALFRYTRGEKDVNSTAIWGYTQIGCYMNDLDATTSTGNSASSTFVLGNCFYPGGPNNGTTNPIPAPEATPGALAIVEDPYSVTRNSPSRSLLKTDSLSLTLDTALSFADLKVIAAFSGVEGQNVSDFDYTGGAHGGNDALNQGFAGRDQEQDATTLEVQMSSNDDGNLFWVAGLYYYTSENNNGFGFTSNGQYLPYSTNRDDFVSDSSAIFGQATYSFSDTSRLILGARYNKDERELSSSSKFDDSEVTWKAGFEYDLGDSSMGYATASTGYRVGGVNGSGQVAAGAPPTFDPETVTAMEVGYKTTLLDDTMLLNLALYHNQYRDMHAQSFVTACIDPNDLTTCIASEFTENGGEVDATGFEVEMQWVPTDNTFVNGTLSIQDSEFGEYNISQVPGLGNFENRQDVTRTTGELAGAGESPQLSLRGWEPALNAGVTASLQVGRTFELANGSTLTPMLLTEYSGKYWSFDVNVPGSEQDAYTRTDLRLVWENIDSGLELEFFVLNLEDEAVLTRSVVFTPSQAAVPTASIQANYADPRVWGFGLRYEFD